mmetsp:Transcript_12922/g.45395  ORF Transcript_12922/g.45395 Transcript_12922/m.45395 type:complete len:199 (+) Transcript_12922:2106-2702(+)
MPPTSLTSAANLSSVGRRSMKLLIGRGTMALAMLFGSISCCGSGKISVEHDLSLNLELVDCRHLLIILHHRHRTQPNTRVDVRIYTTNQPCELQQRWRAASANLASWENLFCRQGMKAACQTTPASIVSNEGTPHGHLKETHIDAILVKRVSAREELPSPLRRLVAYCARDMIACIGMPRGSYIILHAPCWDIRILRL